MKIFLSSTFKDLEPHRSEVLRRLRELDGVVVRCMEDFGARTGLPKDFCVHEARECDLFVGLVGHLYGFIPDGDGTSITEQEYDAAKQAGKDRLIFVAPDDFPVPAVLWRGDSDPKKQEAFRARVLNENVAGVRWSTPEELAGGLVGAVYNWQRGRVGGSAAAMPGTPKIDRLTYYQRCRTRWETVDLSTLATPGALDLEVERPKLSQVFIPQFCRRSRPAVSLPRDYLEEQGLDPKEEERLLEALRARWQRQERLPSLELLASSDAGKLVLLGDPGAGKSSLTRFVLLRLLDPLTRPDETTDDWRLPLQGAWPVLVELRDLLARESEGKCQDLLGYLAYAGETQGFGFDRAALEAQLRNAPSLLIVDGLDEIFSPSRRRAMVEEIVGLGGRFPRARVLVTSRIAGFDARPFEEAGFTIATLDDLDAEQIRTFAKGWFALAFPGEAEKADRARDDLLDALERRPQLSAIAGNPLLLTIMAIIARHQRLARSRTQLYAQALGVLCYAWDYRRGLKLSSDSPLADLQPDDTLLMLRRIAWRMQESSVGLRGNAIRESELKSILKDFFEHEWHFLPPRARRAAAEMVQLLQERNWVLTTRGPALYGFVHRTFLEYLCALELTKRFEAQEVTLEALRDEHVLKHVDDDSYSEVIRLLCGQLPVRAADQLITAICPPAERAVVEEHRLLLAWQSLGELEPRVLASAPTACDAVLRGLYVWLGRCDFEFRQVSAEKFVEAIGMIEPGSWPDVPADQRGFPWSDSAFPYESTLIASALAKTNWLPDESKRLHLFSLADSKSWTVRRGIVSVLGSELSQDRRVFPLLRARAGADDSERVRETAVGVLAERFADRPETFELLRAWAGADDSERVRETAVAGLAERFADRPETFELLRARAEADDSESVRATAVRELAERFANRPETFELLRAWAGADDSERVRVTAVRVLAERFADRPETFELLRAWAGADDSERVRVTAVRVLAERFVDRPETFELLRAWAGADDNESVRDTAVRVLAERFVDRPETFELLRARAGADDSESVRETAVRVLAERFADRPETFEFLRARAGADDSESVRATAVRVLAERFVDRPETFELLRAWAGADDSESVRATAVRVLAERFADRPETFELLRAWAGADDSESVRETAVGVLAERFADRPETFELLRARAGADDSESVRETAVRVLAERFVDRPETFELLRARAGADDSESVRETAVRVLAERFADRPETFE
ncbi:HEAT repeat domain-containing protein, partial [Pyxidicoccus caerfyrddinensis]|uniref:HEAT repeat domain-containing protein n=1 Tax=Pyxidicoccus caerfyrddinensis TaxID=2709663 RepID=UPI0013DA5652